MIELIFTVDYEIYGNGRGSLRELVYEPAERLRSIFEKFNTRFVTFVEAAELEMIETKRTDEAIYQVKYQLRDFHAKGFELGLHLHPQWFNASYENGKWLLDYDEYNLCILPRDRIRQIVARSVNYLRDLSADHNFTPISFRAGNWLLQPSRIAASVLAECGVKIDSSVYKGGLQYQLKLDYRKSRHNGYCWRFSDDVNIPDPQGIILEIPTYTKMVPIWNMLSSKRIRLQQKGSSPYGPQTGRFSRLRDFLRPTYPMKLDFCRLTIKELTYLLDKEIQKDREDASLFRPVVVIGHTKDLIDPNTIEAFIFHVLRKGISISTFRDVYNKCSRRA